MATTELECGTTLLPRTVSRVRLLLFAILLPAAIAGSNQWLYEAIPYSPWLRSWLYPWMTLTTAVLSWCAGRYLSSAMLRWIVFSWCLALLDLLTLAACQDGRIHDHFGYVLVSSQISLLVLWAVLATTSWQWRLPAVLVASPLIIGFTGAFTDDWWARAWNLTMVLAALAVTLVALWLRWRGFKLHRVDVQAAPSTPEPLIAANQFGMKHMLVWATAIVPLLLIARGIRFFMFAELADFESAFAAMAVALFLSTVNLLAIWAVLGSGPVIARVLAIAVIPPPLAIGLSAYSQYIAAKYGRWPNVPILDAVYEMGEHWIAWLSLNAALLAALLLFLRASGYRLSKKNAELSK